MCGSTVCRPSALPHLIHPKASNITAYQSALLTTPLVIFMLLTNLVIPLWTWLRTLIVLAGIGITLYTAFRAYRDAQDGLSRFWLPYIGEIAERYVNEE